MAIGTADYSFSLDLVSVTSTVKYDACHLCLCSRVVGMLRKITIVFFSQCC